MSGRSLGTSRVISGQGDCIWFPRVLTRRYAIVWGPPGADTSSAGIDPATEPGQFALLRALVDAGALVICCDWDGHAFGNDTVVTHLETFRSTLLSAIPAAVGMNGAILDTSKLVLAGFSQGATDHYRYAETNPTRTRAVASLAGVSDLTGFYSGTYRWGSDAGTANQAQIATAWGVTAPAALPARADPYDNAAAMAAVPTWIGYSTADTTVTPAQCQAMAAAIGSAASTVQVSNTSTHGDTEASDALTAGVAGWLLQMAA